MKDDAELTGLFERRQARRRRLAELSFEEKMEIVERLRALQGNRSLMSASRLKADAVLTDKGDEKNSTP